MVTTAEWFVAVTAVAAAVELTLALVAVRHREVPGAVPYAWLSLAAGGWAAFELASTLSADPAAAKLFYRLGTATSYQVAMLWFVFAVVYVGHREWLSPGRLVALWTPLTAYVLVRLTEPWHGLFDASLAMETAAGVTAPAPEPSPWILGASLAAYVYVLAGFGLLAAFLLNSRNLYRKQTAAIVVGGLFPTVGSVLFTAGFSFHPGLSLTPPTFAVNGLVTAFALFRYDFLAVAPIAKDVLVDELPDPMLVVDGDDVILDYNPAASRQFGDDLADSHVGDVADGLADRIRERGRLTLDRPGSEGASHAFDLQVTEIEDRFGNSRGRLVLFRDVSTQRRRVDQLSALQATTQRFIGARTIAEAAESAVEFASDSLDHPLAVLFVQDEETDVLEARAVSDSAGTRATVSGSETGAGTEDSGPGSSAKTDADAVARAGDHGDRDIGAVEAEDFDDFVVAPNSGPFWEAYESGEATVLGDGRDLVVGGERFPTDAALLLPLGDYGLLAVGSDSEEFETAERKLLRILARTTETAVTRIEHEQQLRASRAAVERRNKQIEFFDGVLRHNVRNSMLVIDGHAEFLADDVDEQADKLATIREWCADLTELTEKIRAINDTLTRSESERLGPVDLTAVLCDRTEWLHDRYDDVEVEIEVEVHEGAVVSANELVEDVLESVLLNAVEHNDADRPRVSVRTRTVGDWVQVRIADNGPGISEEVRSQVFQRDVGTSQTAHGFGLYFVSVMMDLYSGNVWFEDNDPRGTVVVLEFELVDGTPLTPSGEG